MAPSSYVTPTGQLRCRLLLVGAQALLSSLLLSLASLPVPCASNTVPVRSSRASPSRTPVGHPTCRSPESLRAHLPQTLEPKLGDEQLFPPPLACLALTMPPARLGLFHLSASHGRLGVKPRTLPGELDPASSLSPASRAVLTPAAVPLLAALASRRGLW